MYIRAECSFLDENIIDIYFHNKYSILTGIFVLFPPCICLLSITIIALYKQLYYANCYGVVNVVNLVLPYSQ